MIARISLQERGEASVDIAGHCAKHVDELKDVKFDCVVTVCDRAREVFPGKTRMVQKGFDDPPALARSARTERVGAPS